MTKAIRSRIFFVRNMDGAEIRESDQRELRQATQGGKEKMRKKMIYTMMITGVLAINLTGCGSKTEKQEVTATEAEITQESDNVQNESEDAVEADLMETCRLHRLLWEIRWHLSIMILMALPCRSCYTRTQMEQYMER